MISKAIAIFDIGKTNKKFLLFDQKLKIIYQSEQKFKTTVDESGFECDDIIHIQNWIVDTLNRLIENAKYDIQGINFSTYGASLAFLNKEGGLLTPIYNYLKAINTDIQNTLFAKYGGVNEFCRQTASPALGLLLNAGIQILWLKKEKQEIWNQVKNILHLPQYLSYILTGKLCSEPTSIGCHTFMWNFDQMQYHTWVKELKVDLPTPVNNNTVYHANIKGKPIKTGVGIHDSSASLVPYLENSTEKFILVSTGTWCISMNPYNNEPLTSHQLMNDCLCFLSTQKQQVKSSRLFMGHYHEQFVKMLNTYFKVDSDYYKNIPYQENLIKTLYKQLGDNRVFFPMGINEFERGISKIDLSVFYSFNEAYSYMVMELTHLCIASINLIIPSNDQTEVIYVSGGFARNPIFLNILTKHFSNKKVFTSDIDNASALGAALVIADQIDGFGMDTNEFMQEIRRLV
ncbi:FGGY-family carbohydrate kinase [Saccharicrinis fermentans]|uniref:Rhamnulokinase n=1 Tax=Saccharicrinis fermentans DSM 9555 = JCM 21142 TaxID=869213 RepID=W7Y2D0_9BACT|nr:FGGY family carbohydrate kinase [Saccharicrinis fermentans]GAF02097.1 rhamnulokinase [Saccharicrinis fermentans DSM 9555 = JCM 21142]